MSEETFAIPETPPSKLGPLSFIVTLIVATLLFLATNGSAILVVLPCIHAGWSTFCAGLWLLRWDPNRVRARVCFIFYIAAACWKAALAALLTVLVFGLAENNLLGRKPNDDEIASVLIMLFGGATLNTIIGITATIAALRHRVRVWVHPQLGRSMEYQYRLFGVVKLFYRRFNHAIFVVGTALVLPPVIIGCFLLAVMTVGNNANQVPDATEIIVTLGVLFGGPLAMIPCYARLSSRIIARSPQECWPE
jgi:hypothetical protein